MRRGLRIASIAIFACLAAAYVWFVLVGGRDAIEWHAFGRRIELLAPRMLAIGLLLPLLLWFLPSSLADLPPLQRALLWALRGTVVVLLALALGRLATTTSEKRVCTVLLVDVSDSVPDAAIARAHDYVSKAYAVRGENTVRVVTFAQRPRLLPISEEAREVPDLQRHGDGRPGGDGAGSNVQAALQLAYGLYPPGYLRRAVILSDGNETAGSMLAEVRRAGAQGVRVHVVPQREAVPADVLVRAVELPGRIKVGETFDVTVRVHATTPTKARMRLYQGDLLNGLGGVRTVELPAGESTHTFPSVVRLPGDVTYRATLDEMPGDRFSDNDRYSTSTTVPGRPSVLYLEGDTRRGAAFAQALAANDFDVEVRGAREVPTSRQGFDRYDFVVVSDVGAENFSLTSMQALEEYVRTGGGGFLMAGGERSFGPGGYTGTRMERILPVRFDAERRRDQPSVALALVIDKSGSMQGQAIELAKDAAKAAAEVLGEGDFIEVIGFDSQPNRIVKMQAARNRVRILNDISRLTAGGGTAIFPALDAAYQDLAVTRARTRHVILLSDGQAPTEGILDLVQVAASEGITFSTVGLGQADRGLLEQIAARGRGRSYFTNDPFHVPRIFTQETNRVARSAFVEEWFNPRIVRSAQFLRGVSPALPELQGYVTTKAKPTPAEVILDSIYGEPILARWRVGLGWTLAWTTDVKGRWASAWTSWPDYGKFWAQLVREHMRQRRRTLYDMRAEWDGERVRVQVDAMSEDDRFINGLESTLTVTAADGPRAAPPTKVRFEQSAPGRYEASLPLDRFGSFVLRAEHRDDGRLVAESFANVSNPFPREYLATSVDAETLGRLARATGGIVSPEPRAVFAPGRDSLRFHRDLWPKLVTIAIVVFLFDLLLRRVRLFDRGFRRG